MGRRGSHSFGKTEKDQMEHTTERLVKTRGKDPQRSSKTESLRVSEIDAKSIPAILKDPQGKQKKNNQPP